jgi:hypothetical protein
MEPLDSPKVIRYDAEGGGRGVLLVRIFSLHFFISIEVFFFPDSIETIPSRLPTLGATDPRDRLPAPKDRGLTIAQVRAFFNENAENAEDAEHTPRPRPQPQS